MSAERFEFEDFELDRSAYELRRAGTVVRLERIPLELLFVLIERRGQLVTRQEIFERIWGKGVFVDTDNSINTAVNKIRRALNDDADKPRFVVTVPARGYRFIAPIREEGGLTAPLSEASAVSPVVEASPTASAVDAGPMTITKAPLRKYRPRGLLASIVGIAFVIAVIALIQQLSLRPPNTTASIPPAQHPALPLPNMPSIAVLPFTNLSGDPQQEYFSDGITDDLITELSRGPDIFVIAPTSAFIYKSKAVKVQEVGRELGVKYVLEGSVRKAGHKVRIDAQLVDATTGADLWAERYDRPLRDIFSVQNEVVRRIVTTLNLQLTLWEEHSILARKRTDNLEAYDDFLRGLEYQSSFSKEGNAKARQMFEKAIELDPKYVDAYVNLGWCYWGAWLNQWSEGLGSLERAFELAQTAVALDDSDPTAHALLGRLLVQKRQYDQAIVEGERSIALGPNVALDYMPLAETLDFAGKPEQAIQIAEREMRLDPGNRDCYLIELGAAYVMTRRYEEAVPILERYLAKYPDVLGAHAVLAVAYSELGLKEQAQAEAAEIIRISPRFSLEMAEKRSPLKDQTSRDRVFADLRKAGLK